MLTPQSEVQQVLSGLLEHGRIVDLGKGHYIHQTRYDACCREIEATVLELAGGDQRVMSVDVSELRGDLDWSAQLWSRILQRLEADGLIAVRANRVVLLSAVHDLSEHDAHLVQRLQALYEESGFHSPRPDELTALLNTAPDTVQRLLTYLVDAGELVRVTKNVILTKERLREAQTLVVRTIREQGILDSADFKLAIDSTRKYAIAILDYLDSKGVTLRRGNDRRLAPNYERNLL